MIIEPTETTTTAKISSAPQSSYSIESNDGQSGNENLSENAALSARWAAAGAYEEDMREQRSVQAGYERITTTNKFLQHVVDKNGRVLILEPRYVYDTQEGVELANISDHWQYGKMPIPTPASRITILDKSTVLNRHPLVPLSAENLLYHQKAMPNQKKRLNLVVSPDLGIEWMNDLEALEPKRPQSGIESGYLEGEQRTFYADERGFIEKQEKSTGQGNCSPQTKSDEVKSGQRDHYDGLRDEEPEQIHKLSSRSQPRSAAQEVELANYDKLDDTPVSTQEQIGKSSRRKSRRVTSTRDTHIVEPPSPSKSVPKMRRSEASATIEYLRRSLGRYGNPPSKEKAPKRKCPAVPPEESYTVEAPPPNVQPQAVRDSAILSHSNIPILRGTSSYNMPLRDEKPSRRSLAAVPEKETYIVEPPSPNTPARSKGHAKSYSSAPLVSRQREKATSRTDMYQRKEKAPKRRAAKAVPEPDSYYDELPSPAIPPAPTIRCAETFSAPSPPRSARWNGDYSEVEKHSGRSQEVVSEHESDEEDLSPPRKSTLQNHSSAARGLCKYSPEIKDTELPSRRSTHASSFTGSDI